MSFLSTIFGDCPMFWAVAAVGVAIVYYFLNQKKEAASSNAAPSTPTPSTTMQLIKNRRTIMPKELNGEPLKREHLDLILEAANWAPTHQKNQPWRYVVLSGPDAIRSYLDFLDKWYADHAQNLPEEAVTKFRNKLEGVYKEWPAKVSHAALIIMKREPVPGKRLPEWEELSAVAMSVQNMHLMASSLEVGGFWSSHTWCKDARDSAGMKTYLGLDPEDKMLGAFTMGYYDTEKTFKSTRSPMSEKVEYRHN